MNKVIENAVSTLALLFLALSLIGIIGYGIAQFIPASPHNTYEGAKSYCATKDMIPLTVRGDWYCIKGEKI